MEITGKWFLFVPRGALRSPLSPFPPSSSSFYSPSPFPSLLLLPSLLSRGPVGKWAGRKRWAESEREEGRWVGEVGRTPESGDTHFPVINESQTSCGIPSRASRLGRRSPGSLGLGRVVQKACSCLVAHYIFFYNCSLFLCRFVLSTFMCAISPVFLFDSIQDHMQVFDKCLYISHFLPTTVMLSGGRNMFLMNRRTNCSSSLTASLLPFLNT